MPNKTQYRIVFQRLCASLAILISGLIATAQQYQWGALFPCSAGEFGYARGLGTDALGNSYVAGSFSATMDTDPGPGTTQMLGAPFGFDGYVIKLSSAGNLIWSEQLSSATDERIETLVTTSQGDVFVGGMFNGTLDLDPGAGQYTVSAVAGSYDAFVVKLDSTGSFLWGATWGSGSFTGVEAVVDMDLGPSGDVFVTLSAFASFDLDPGAAVVNGPFSGFKACHVVQLTDQGQYVDARSWTASATVDIRSVAINGTNLAVCGRFEGTMDLDPNAGSDPATLPFGGFVAHMDLDGTYHWGHDLPVYTGSRTTVDAAGNVWACGNFTNIVDMDPGVGSANVDGAFQALFIAKYDPLGVCTWARALVGGDYAEAFVVDGSGMLFLGGHAHNHIDLDFGTTTQWTTYEDGQDAYLLAIDVNGNLTWSGIWSGIANNTVEGLAIDPAGALLISGTNGSTVDLDPTATAQPIVSVGSDEPWVVKLGTMSMGIPVEAPTVNAPLLYPNPAHDRIRLVTDHSSDRTTVEVFDHEGRCVLEASRLPADGGFSVATLANGAYTVRCSSPSSVRWVRFLKQ